MSRKLIVFKLPTMIIFKNLKNKPKGQFPNDVVICASKGGTMTTNFFLKEYIPNVWNRRPNAIFRAKSLLIMDTVPSHTTDEVKNELKKVSNTSPWYIQGGMTPLIQPLDTHINKPFKDILRRKWEDWLLEGEQQFTRYGNRKSASYVQVATWVSDAWKEIPCVLLKKSLIQNGVIGYEGNRDVLWSQLKEMLDSVPTGNVIDIPDGTDASGEEDEEEIGQEAETASSEEDSEETEIESGNDL